MDLERDSQALGETLEDLDLGAGELLRDPQLGELEPLLPHDVQIRGDERTVLRRMGQEDELAARLDGRQVAALPPRSGEQKSHGEGERDGGNHDRRSIATRRLLEPTPGPAIVNWPFSAPAFPAAPRGRIAAARGRPVPAPGRRGAASRDRAEALAPRKRSRPDPRGRWRRPARDR